MLTEKGVQLTDQQLVTVAGAIDGAKGRQDFYRRIIKVERQQKGRALYNQVRRSTQHPARNPRSTRNPKCPRRWKPRLHSTMASNSHRANLLKMYHTTRTKNLTSLMTSLTFRTMISELLWTISAKPNKILKLKRKYVIHQEP